METKEPSLQGVPHPAKAPDRGVTRIGESIHIKGELSGNEDLEIAGKVEGKVGLEGHDLTIRETGDIEGDIIGKNVQVRGKVIGDITATERLEIKSPGSVLGDLKALKIVIEDGVNFKGSVEVEIAPAEVTPPQEHQGSRNPSHP